MMKARPCALVHATFPINHPPLRNWGGLGAPMIHDPIWTKHDHAGAIYFMYGLTMMPYGSYIVAHGPYMILYGAYVISYGPCMNIYGIENRLFVRKTCTVAEKHAHTCSAIKRARPAITRTSFDRIAASERAAVMYRRMCSVIAEPLLWSDDMARERKP